MTYLAEKVKRASQIVGPKLFTSLAVCPTGWGFDPALSYDIAKSAIDTGVWPLKEALDGQVRHTHIPHRLHPVSEYLEPQRRFRHLFKPVRRDQEIAEIQEKVNRYWDDAMANSKQKTSSS